MWRPCLSLCLVYLNRNFNFVHFCTVSPSIHYLVRNSYCDLLSFRRNFWRLDVWNQGSARATVLHKALRKTLFISLGFWWLQAFPWHVAALLQSLSQSHMAFCSASHLLLIRTVVTGLPLGNPEWSYLKILNLIISAKTSPTPPAYPPFTPQ